MPAPHQRCARPLTASSSTCSATASGRLRPASGQLHAHCATGQRSLSTQRSKSTGPVPEHSVPACDSAMITVNRPCRQAQGKDNRPGCRAARIPRGYAPLSGLADICAMADSSSSVYVSRVADGSMGGHYNRERAPRHAAIFRHDDWRTS